MGNFVEDQMESDEVASAAYALDRMSASEIAKIISGDKREAVMRALAEQFSGEQILGAVQRLPNFRVIGKLESRPDLGGRYQSETINTLEGEKYIGLDKVGAIYQIKEQTVSHQNVFSEASPTILITKTGERFQTLKDIQTLSALHHDFLQHASGYATPDPKFWFGVMGTRVEILVPRI